MPINSNALIFIPVFFLFAVNLLFLDIVVFSQQKPQSPSQVVVESIPLPTPADTSCPSSCIAKIDEKLKPVQVNSVSPASPAREFYVSLGTGTTKNSDYEDILSAEAYIDTGNYSSIKQAVVELFLRNPTGNGRIYAKLYNVTDKHDVWFSEVFTEGGGPVVKKEVTVTLDRGNKLYRVMMKSTMKYDAWLDNARIKIITN
ncbi:MAG: hypothetical protein AAB457_02650 [Patescibacteria group bacterium]